MAAPTIYRSSDTNAPILSGNAGSLLAVLTACLVNGYGSTKATATVTSNGTNVSDGDTVTVNGTAYTFKTALTPTAGEVLIGANAAASLSNLGAAMGALGTSGTTYAAGTTTQTVLQVITKTATVLTLEAFVGGTGGNAYTLAKSAATLSVSGATFSGGAGTDTTASLGWGSPFTAANKAVFRAASGVRHYLDVDDSAPNSTANGRNAPVRAYETMTAVATGTNAFPTTTQVTTCVGIVKSTTANEVNRPWLLIGDAKTFYFYVESAGAAPPVLSTHTWTSMFFFGEMLSALTGDNYRTIYGFQSTTATVVTAGMGAITCISVSNSTSAINEVMARSYAGAGSSVWVCTIGNIFGAIASLDGGTFTYPNGVDGGLYMNEIDIYERGNAATAATCISSAGVRGRLRGLLNSLYTGTGIDDQTTFTGAGDFAARTFIILRTSGGMVIHETTAWNASS